MNEAWTATKDTRLAAAMATLGVVVRLDHVIDERSGREHTTFFLGSKSVDGEFVPSTQKLKSEYESGELEEKNPSHPLLDCIRGLYNWGKILDAVNKGHRIHLAKAKGADRGVYVDGDQGFLGTGGQPHMTTGDLKMVAALAVVGVPILAVQGPRGARKFSLPLSGLRFSEIHLPVNAGVMMTDYREGSFADPESPFLYAMKAQVAKERLLDAIRNDEKMILLRKTNTPRAAYVNEGATDAKMDKVLKHWKK